MPSPVVLTMRPRWPAIFGSISSARSALEPAERPFLIAFDQARIAGDVGREDCCAPTFDASLPCRLHGASSVAVDTTPCGNRRALSKNPPSSLRHDQRVSCAIVWGPPGLSVPVSRLFPAYGNYPGFPEPEIPGCDAGRVRSGPSKRLIEKALFHKSRAVSRRDRVFCGNFPVKPGICRRPGVPPCAAGCVFRSRSWRTGSASRGWGGR